MGFGGPVNRATLDANAPGLEEAATVVSKSRVTSPVWMHWAGIVAIVATSTAFVSVIDPNPGINLAREASVTVSSSDGTLDSAKGAADGDIWEVGFRTRLEENPWLLLDLRSTKRVSRIVVYNCYDRYPY